MRIVKNLVARWSSQLKRYIIVEADILEHHGPVAYAFGGGGGGTEVVPTGPYGPQIPFISSLFQEAAGLYGQGPTQYPGFPTVAQPGADLTGSQEGIAGAVAGNADASQTAIDTALQTALTSGQNPVSNVANPLGGDLQSALYQLLLGGQLTNPGATGAINTATGGTPDQGFTSAGAPTLDPAGIDINPTLQSNLGGSGLNPFIEDVIAASTRSLNNNYQQNILPSIGDAASDAGQYGGARHGIAEGIAAQGQQQAVADVTAQLFGQGFDRNIDVQQNALSQVGGAQGLEGQFALGAGGLNEQVRSAILSQMLQGTGLSQSALSTGTSQIGNLLQAGNAQGLTQLFSALGILPALQGSQLSQYGALNQSGLQQLGLDQSNIDAQIQQFFYDQYAPYNALSQFQNFIGGAYGSSVGGDPNNNAYGGSNTNLFAPPPVRGTGPGPLPGGPPPPDGSVPIQPPPTPPGTQPGFNETSISRDSVGAQIAAAPIGVAPTNIAPPPPPTVPPPNIAPPIIDPLLTTEPIIAQQQAAPQLNPLQYTTIQR